MSTTLASLPLRPLPLNETSALVFQCKDLLARDTFVKDERSDDSDDDSSESGSSGRRGGAAYDPADKISRKRFQILIFGTTAEGDSVTLQVNNFRPFFYVRIPEALANSAVAERNLHAWLLNGVPMDAVEHTTIEKERHQTLFDYNGGEMATFLKVIVPSQILWRSIKDRLLDKKTSTPIAYETRSLFGMAAVDVLKRAACSDDVAHVEPDGSRVALKIYEANIDPMLRFFHIQDISPAGWVKVEAGAWEKVAGMDAKTRIVGSCDYNAVHAGSTGMAPFLVGSWDIECMSSHGDFPQARKTWYKPVREMLEGALPATLDELCDQLAKALEGKGPLSKIYLKHPFGGKTNGETIKNILIAKNQKRNVEDRLSALQTFVKAKNATAAAKAVGVTGTKKAAIGGGKLLDLGAMFHDPDNEDGAASIPAEVKTKDTLLAALDEALTLALPEIAGDEIIQIGLVLYRRGVAESKHIWVLGSVDEDAVRPPGADVPIRAYGYSDEAAMIQNWFLMVARFKIDVLIGYNIFGFDSKYVYDRLISLKGAEAAKKIMEPLSCLRSRPPRLEEKFLSSSAMGDNTMYFLSSPGRLQIDLLPYVRRNHNLDSYTLDNVSATFVSGNVSSVLTCVDASKDWFRFTTKSTKGTVVGRFITILDVENDRVVDRCEVVGVEPKALVVHIEGGAAALAENGGIPVRWAQVKDDVSPKDIFRLHKGTAEDRAIIARYCLQDCDLVMELFHKLEVLNNSVAMADVCSVPVSFIFTRGQGIKIESLIFKECRLSDQLIEVLPSAAREEGVLEGAKETGSDDGDDEVEDSYEGAIVLEPHTGIYLDDPVTADDFASLYPSTIISENISHDTLIWVKDYDNDGNFVCVKEGSDKYDNLPGARYVNIEFDILRVDPADKRKHPAKIRDGKRVARYIQPPAAGSSTIGAQGTIPRILGMLLDSRKKCRKLAEAETEDFRKALLDAQQLAYKLTANSLYGQLGSGTFKIRRQVLAASTTGYGRKQLMYAKSVIEAVYGGGKDPRCDVECVYGDTDSIFLRFRPRDPVTGERLTGKEALRVAKALTEESGNLVSSCLKPPHWFEFDKIFKSFILLSKKRYVGDMSEDGVEDADFHRKSMGIVMKRRDNAPIVKYVYGNAVDKILCSHSVEESVKEATAFVQSAARDLLNGKFPLSKLTITKSLRANYADPTRIAHKVLADRIGERDPGNKPSTSDRIPFVYISHGAGAVPKLQGDRIETPSYIRDNDLTPDYTFYITNQIAKPISQVFGLAVEKMPGVTAKDLGAIPKARDPVAAREALASGVLFKNVMADHARRPEVMESKGQRSIASLLISHA